MNIGLLTTGFAVISVGIIVAALYRFRRAPIVWLITRNERQAAGLRASLAALREVLDDARTTGDAALYAQLARSYARQRAMVMAIDAKAEIPPVPSFPAISRAA